MRFSFTVSTLAVLALVMIVAIVPGFGKDYLVINPKKGGPAQRVPLEFAPDQIESFQVEPAPSGGDAAGAPEPAAQPPAVTPGTQVPGGESEPKPLRIQPRPGPQGPSGREDALQPGPRQDSRAPVVGISEGGPSGPRAPRGPAQTPTADRGEKPGGPSKGAVAGPVAAEAPIGKGTLFVNIYKLPGQIKALPDYSAFRPAQTVTADRINLEPSRGANEPAGLPQDTAGLGLRFMGMFAVAGEGIFRWRVQAKDGVRLHIDDKTLIESDGLHEAVSKTGYLHLSEGIHSIILDSFNSSGPPSLKLFVTPPLGKEELFSVQNGLAGWKEPAQPYDVLWGQVYFVPKGRYPQGPDFSRISPIGRIIAPQLSISGGEGFPGLPDKKDMVGISYEGYFNVKGAGIFAFRMLADNYARLTIGEKEIMEVSGGTKNRPRGEIGWAFLQNGSYPIRLDYFHPEGTPQLELYVTQPTKAEEVFAPARTLDGYVTEGSTVSLIPAFVYFLKPDTKKIPSYNKMSPAGMFFTESIDFPVDRGSEEFPGVPKREEWLGLRFYVKFTLSEQEAGTYKFRVVCRDAARLIIGKKLIINLEGAGRTQEKAGSADMQAGSHEMFLDYMQTRGPNGIQLFITPPGGGEKIFAFQ